MDLSSKIKHCPSCSQHLSIDDFGVCRRRPDGHNLYCKSCIRNKGTERRANRRQFNLHHAARLKALAAIPHKQRVLRVISAGPLTQLQIAKLARLREDEVADAICGLLLWSREISSSGDGLQRVYFLREPETPRPAVIEDRRRTSSFTDLANVLGPRVRGSRVCVR